VTSFGGILTFGCSISCLAITGKHLDILGFCWFGWLGTFDSLFGYNREVSRELSFNSQNLKSCSFTLQVLLGLSVSGSSPYF
jgi:hypothetical protein